MVLCKDCKFLHNGTWCMSPSNGMSPVNGKPIIKFASINRLPHKTTILEDEKLTCGLEAMFFESITDAPNNKISWLTFWK